MAEEKLPENVSIINGKRKRKCIKCNKIMDEATQFYVSKKNDIGVLPMCKKCYTMHIDLRRPQTFLPLMEELDLPFIESEWYNIVDKHANNPKTTSTAIFGRYVSLMKLNQYNTYGYKDTDQFMAAEKLAKLKAAAEKLKQINKYREISQQDQTELDNLLQLNVEEMTDQELKDFLNGEDYFNLPSADGEKNEKTEPIAAAAKSYNRYSDLTKEDKLYLQNKWGTTNSIEECIKLEKLYLEMMDSYDIRSASHKDYLLKICKVSLKMDQALDINDIDGYQKLSKVYDMMMKSAKFTAAQIKDKEEDYDSIGVIVAQAESQGFIPKFDTSEPQDVVDFTLKDMNKYLRNLVMNEMNLGNSIEIYLKKMEQEENREEGEIDNDEDEYWIPPEEEVKPLTDEDFEEFSDFVETERELDIEEMMLDAEI